MRKIHLNLELAKKRFVNCSKAVGKACLDWEDEESVMEVEVSELVPLLTGKEPVTMSSEEEGTGGRFVVEGQLLSDQVIQLASRIQNLNLEYNHKVHRVPRALNESLSNVDDRVGLVLGWSLGVPGSGRAPEF